MKQLQEEVNEMKTLMAALKKGSAISEIFGGANAENSEGGANRKVDAAKKYEEQYLLESIKAQRLEDLKRQRQTLEVQDAYANELQYGGKVPRNNSESY